MKTVSMEEKRVSRLSLCIEDLDRADEIAVSRAETNEHAINPRPVGASGRACIGVSL